MVGGFVRKTFPPAQDEHRLVAPETEQRVNASSRAGEPGSNDRLAATHRPRRYTDQGRASLELELCTVAPAPRASLVLDFCLLRNQKRPDQASTHLLPAFKFLYAVASSFPSLALLFPLLGLSKRCTCIALCHPTKSVKQWQSALCGAWRARPFDHPQLLEPPGGSKKLIVRSRWQSCRAWPHQPLRLNGQPRLNLQTELVCRLLVLGRNKLNFSGWGVKEA